MTQHRSTLTFGEFIEDPLTHDEYLTLQFLPGSALRKQRWSNYGLSADFLGDYFAAFFPGEITSDRQISQKDTVKGAVSYIANELLENAVKYSDDSAKLPISISLHFSEQQIIFRVVNYTNQPAVERYQQFIQTMLSSDLDELYMEQLEKTALGDGGSNMGVLTMMNDYSARFGWRFQPLETSPDIFQVNVVTYLDV